MENEFELGQRVWFHRDPYGPSYTVDEVMEGIITGVRGDFITVLSELGERTETTKGSYANIFLTRKEVLQFYADEAMRFGQEKVKRANILYEAARI